MSRPFRVQVVGAGLGGLAAALSFARGGAEVEVFEKAEVLSEVGAGIQMSPNAVKALQWMGLDLAAARPFHPEAVELRRHRSGRLVHRLALGAEAEARWGAPYLQVHRADIHGALLEAAKAAGVQVHLGRDVSAYEILDGGVAARLSWRAASAPLSAPVEPAVERRSRPRPPSLNPGAAPTGTLAPPAKTGAADLVIVADGVRSALRQQMIPATLGVHFSGNVAFRGTVPAEALPKGLVRPVASVWMGPRRHFVNYFVRGGELVNFVAVAERTRKADETWSQPADPEALRREFSGWHETVRAILGACEAPMEWGLFGHAPLHRWSDGPVALLGDAAHPTTPFLAQGAAMAFEDAVTLARVIPVYGVPYGLQAYRKLRFTRCTHLQQAAARTGARFHARSALDGFVKAAALEAFTRLSPGSASNINDWIYDHDPGRAPV
ncbi:FAD-dependent monooxygenase [Rhodovulum sp. DZ06]|uniref:FAD-dependent monooxygenase n=1 Tax=Rhodovulum sp. DZ06 TaxID=3425126 RepID=UPI003D330F7B